MKKVFLLLILALFTVNTFATNVVSPEEAQQVAKNFMSERFGTERFSSSDFVLLHTEVDENGEAVLYRFQVGEQGFIMISATNLTTPVLAYSLESNYEGNETTKYLYEKYTNSIKFVKANPHAALMNTRDEWKQYADVEFKARKKSGESKAIKFLEPLVTTTWNQGKYYNQYCPYDTEAGGPDFDFRTPNGCVALNMINILNFHRYPSTGVGGVEREHPQYGKLSANFAQGVYNYDAMTNVIAGGYQGPFAELVYHCGLAVKMNYGPTGSGSISQEVPIAMYKYFGFANAQYVARESYNNDYRRWETEVLIPELDKHRPIYYSGRSSDYSGGGHAWIIDGYMQTDSVTYFHVNWGWGGKDNGFFRIENLMTTSYKSFSSDEATVINLVPLSNKTNKPATSFVRNTASKGSISDGAGDKKYAKNSERKWMIAAPNVKSYTFMFSKIKTEKDHDFITIYNGPTIESGIKAQYSGNYLMSATNVYWSQSIAIGLDGEPLPAAISVTADSVLVVFTSDDNDITDYGFEINYTTYSDAEATCPYMVNVNANNSIIASNPNGGQYRAQSICQWRFAGAPHLGLYDYTFREFDLKNGDVVEIYNNKNNNNPELVQRYDIKNPPKVGTTYKIYTNDVLVKFHSDNWLEGDGFKLEYWAMHDYAVNEYTGIKDISVFPNPATERVNVTFSTESAEKINFKLMDMTGKVLNIDEFAHDGGDFQYSTSVNHLAKGMYILQIQTEKGQVTKKITVN